VVRATGQGLSHEYFLKDHLGSTRVVFDSNGGVLQTTDYYAFGMEHTPLAISNTNRYLYNGKELQDETFAGGVRLGWYDYGKRFLDPQIGRWHSIDKLADDPNQISQSPYQYAWNNPVNLDDPDGNCPWCIVGAIVGAAVDYGAQVAMNYANGDKNPWTNVNGTSIVASAISGAATGGLGSLVKTGAITTTRAVAGSMTIQAAESITKQSSEGDGSVSPTKVVIDVAAGQLADGIPTKNLMPTKQLENQLDRAIRVAGENPRASRAAAVNTAQGKVNTANAINQVNSATQSEVAENSMQAVGGTVVSSGNSSNTSNSSSSIVLMPKYVAPAVSTKIEYRKPITTVNR